MTERRRRRHPARGARIALSGLSAGATLGGAAWLGVPAAPATDSVSDGATPDGDQAVAAIGALTGLSATPGGTITGRVEPEPEPAAESVIVVQRRVVVRHHPADQDPGYVPPAVAVAPRSSTPTRSAPAPAPGPAPAPEAAPAPRPAPRPAPVQRSSGS